MEKIISTFTMENFQLTLSILNILLSIFLVYISSDNSKKLNDRENKRKLYGDFKCCLEKFENKPILMYKKVYIDEIRSFKVAFEMNASKKVNNEYLKIVKLIEEDFNKYNEYCNSIYPYRDENIHEECDEEGNVIGTYLIDYSITEEMFSIYEDEYINHNVYSKEKISKILSNINKYMMDDLK